MCVEINLFCLLIFIVDEFPEDKRGKHAKTPMLLDAHPELQDKLRQWVRANGKKKRKANMKVRDCMNYINTELLRVGTAAALADKGISWSTARAWLHRLGFMVLNHSKSE
jgi:hypothetical protein